MKYVKSTILLAVALLLASCGNRSKLTKEEVIDYGEIGFSGIVSYIVVGYQSHWEDMDTDEMELSDVYRHSSPYCGFCQKDINGDGIPELLIGDRFEDGSTILYDIYTIHPKTAALIHLASGGERDRFTVNESGIIIEEGSNSASDSFTKAYRIENGKLVKLNAVTPGSSPIDIDITTFASLVHGNQEARYPQAEYHKAGSILMFTPGAELFDGVIHPDAGLYERYFDIDKAAEEHRNYISMLEKEGCSVHTVTDIMLSMPHNSLVALAELSLTYDASKLEMSEQEAQVLYKREVLASMSNSDLVRIIINRPAVILKKTGINTGFEAQYVHNPLMNMYFLRDQSITTPKGHVMCRMNSTQRAPEVDIIEACYKQLGESAIYRVSGEDSHLEGGDYIPFGTISLIGQGLRTNQKAIDELLEHDCFGHDTVVVVRERRKDQYQMHLDTYFNVIDKDLCTMCFNRYDAKDISDVNYLTMDMYVRPSGSAEYHLEPSCSGKGFREFLEARGVKIIRISKEDADRYANNFLTIDARKIMSVAGQSKALGDEYAKYGVNVEWVPLDNLIGGYGAAHCMTQVLNRSE